MEREMEGVCRVTREYLGITDAATITGYCSKTIRRAIFAGELRASQRKRRGKWLIRRDELTRWVESEPPCVAAANLRPVTAGDSRERYSLRARLRR
jgi:excisionase family DNA binding protein